MHSLECINIWLE